MYENNSTKCHANNNYFTHENKNKKLLKTNIKKTKKY